MSFLVNPSTPKNLKCPACKAMYNTEENVPRVNDPCRHILCGRCFLLQAGKNCPIGSCAARICEATQATQLVDQLCQSGSAAASFGGSPAASPLSSYCIVAPVDPVERVPATGRSEPRFPIPSPDDEAGISLREFIEEMPDGVAEMALTGRNCGHFLACKTEESLKQRQKTQLDETCQAFRLHYVNRKNQPDKVLINISCAKVPSDNFRDNYGYDLVIEVEKEERPLLTKGYKIDGALQDIPLNANPAPCLSVVGFPEYLQKGGTFWKFHFPRLYQEILKA